MWDLSSLTRDWTYIPYIGRRILNHQTAREVLLLLRSWIIFYYIYIPHFLLPFIHQWTLGYFCLLVIAHNDVINIVVQISLRDPAFSFLGKMPRGRIAWSYGSSIYNFLGSLHIVFHRCCTILHSHQQCPSVLISLYPLQHLFFSFSLYHPHECKVNVNILRCFRCFPKLKFFFEVPLLATKAYP